MPKPHQLRGQTGTRHRTVHCSVPIGSTCTPRRTPCRSRRRIQWPKHRETEVAGLIFLQRRQDLTIPESRGGCGKRQELQHVPSSKHLVACSNQCSSPISLLFLQITFFVVDIWFGKTFFFFFFNDCNKLHLLALAAKIQSNPARQDISPAKEWQRYEKSYPCTLSFINASPKFSQPGLIPEEKIAAEWLFHHLEELHVKRFTCLFTLGCLPIQSG